VTKRQRIYREPDYYFTEVVGPIAALVAIVTVVFCVAMYAVAFALYYPQAGMALFGTLVLLFVYWLDRKG
jgi:hypothetical protein